MVTKIRLKLDRMRVGCLFSIAGVRGESTVNVSVSTFLSHIAFGGLLKAAHRSFSSTALIASFNRASQPSN